MSARVVFWLAGVLIVYAYVGFPLLLLARSLVRRRVEPEAGAPGEPPRVSMIVVAHNEEATIAAKIDNIDSLDYPAGRMEVIIASDGSDDGTNGIVSSRVRAGLRLLELPRSGKIAALNAAAARATGEILVFSDANSMFAPDALRALVAPFGDAAVGAVGGNQCYLPDGDGGHMASRAERLYWAYDRALKRMQSRSGHMTAATGAIHAVRRELFRPVPPGVSDDFMTSTGAIAHGYRLVFEPDAIAYEAAAPSEGAEFERKLRIIVRGLRGLWVRRALFNPLRHGFYSLQLFSHKLLRWSVCWLLLLLFASSLALYGAGGVYVWAARAQLALYGCAALGLALRDTRIARSPLFRPIGLPLYFSLANYAALRAWLQVLGGRRVDAWESGRSRRAPRLRMAASADPGADPMRTS